MASRFQLHVERWQNCQKCTLCHTRGRVVLARGKIPADVLMIGEAPAHSEDSLGVPFCGPAGHLLDEIIANAIPDTVRVAFSNLVCCLPLDENGDKAAEPEAQEIMDCGERLREFVDICKPRLIVAVGQLPKRWLPKILKNYAGKSADITHPAAILRAPSVAQSFMVRRCEIVLRTAIQEITDG